MFEVALAVLVFGPSSVHPIRVDEVGKIDANAFVVAVLAVIAGDWIAIQFVGCDDLVESLECRWIIQYLFKLLDRLRKLDIIRLCFAVEADNEVSLQIFGRVQVVSIFDKQIIIVLEVGLLKEGREEVANSQVVLCERRDLIDLLDLRCNDLP